jgi:hypothetical protein
MEPNLDTEMARICARLQVCIRELQALRARIVDERFRTEMRRVEEEQRPLTTIAEAEVGE